MSIDVDQILRDVAEAKAMVDAGTPPEPVYTLEDAIRLMYDALCSCEEDWDFYGGHERLVGRFNAGKVKLAITAYQSARDAARKKAA